MSDPDAVRAEMLERWGRAAAGWDKRARSVREFGLPVSTWMLDHAGLQPGLRVLELAAGPGETGFLAAELIRPGGSLICSDATDQMLDVARARAEELGVENVEFKRLELEWIDLETASVDVVLCKWGLMFTVDPEAALREVRRVLRPGGRAALAVWDGPPANPWATIPTRVLVELGHTTEPDPEAPGMFALAPPGRLQGLLEDAGFIDVVVDDGRAAARVRQRRGVHGRDPRPLKRVRRDPRPAIGRAALGSARQGVGTRAAVYRGRWEAALAGAVAGGRGRRLTRFGRAAILPAGKPDERDFAG